MAILSTNQRLINVGDSYSAGNGIDITNNIISVTGDNEPYSAGDNIDIQDHIISGKDWSNDIENASANAYNVTTAWVQDNYANSADMTYISAMVDTKLDTSAWSSVSGDLATESYVIMADNINYAQATAYVENQNYANKDFVLDNIDSATSGKLDSSSFASVSGDFLTTSFGISESGAWNEATNCVENNSAAWFDNQGDVEVNELVYAQSANWNEVSSKLNSTAFDTWQQGQYTNDIAGLNNLIGTKLDASSFEETSGTFYPTSNPSGFITGVDLSNYYTNDNPSGFITGVDLSNYYTKDETSGKEELANAFANIPVGDPEVNAYVTSNSASIDESTDLVQSNSSTWNDVTAYQSNSANYITAHQSLEGLMSASLLESADGKWTAYNSIPFKAGDEFPASADEAIQCVQSNSSNWQSVSNKLDSDVFTAWSANQAVNNYQLSAGDGISIIDDDVNKITRIDVTAQYGDMFTSYLEYNDQNHISSYNGSAFEDSAPTLPMTGRDGVDVQMDNGTLVLSSTLYETVTTNSAQWSQGGAGDAEVNAYVYNNSAAIDETVTSYEQNSASYVVENNFEYNGNDLITAYNGSAFAGQGGGGDVPTGTMNVSGLEYNAVNEISAYNGSAIAQYGAEKQWLVHDDTLVHAANSAQYALGVNLSAIAQLLGVDETVLWSGEPQKAPITLSESYKNFKELKIVGRLNDNNAVGTVASWRFDTDIISANPYINCQSFVANSTGNSAYGAYLRNSVEVVSSDTGIGHWHTFSYSYSTANAITMQSNDEWGKLFYYKVIGIGRKA